MSEIVSLDQFLDAPFYSKEIPKRAIQTSEGKIRCVEYKYARSYLYRVVESWISGSKVMDVGDVVRWFEYFLNRQNFKRFIKLVRGDEFVFCRMISRFHKKYKRKVWSRMCDLVNEDWDLKLELTIDGSKFFVLGDEIDYIVKWWNKLRSWLIGYLSKVVQLNMYNKYGFKVSQNYLRKCVSKSLGFVRILEFQKRGSPHFHILLSGIKKVLGYRYIKLWKRDDEDDDGLGDIWQKYGGGYVFVKDVERMFKNKLNAYYYVIKYVNKTIVKSDSFSMMYGALLFASNKRLFGMSGRFERVNRVRNLLEGRVYPEYVVRDRNNKIVRVMRYDWRKGEWVEKDRYEWIGSVSEIDLSMYFDRVDGKMDVDFVKIKASWDDYRRFGELFYVPEIKN